MIHSLLRLAVLFTSLMLFTNIALAQIGNGGWFNLTHTQKLSPKFDLLTDFQFRSANNFDYLGTRLLRGALSYNITKQHSVGLGYGNITDWDMINEERISTLEHRIFQQYIYKNVVERLRLNFRMRFEQRFRGPDAEFSQRLRLQLGAVIPLIADENFTKGMYSLLQSEVMFNVQNKEKINNSFFDQHRPLVALGYRFNKHIDTEVGYLRMQQRKLSGDVERDLVQFRILTNF
jgi:hypothetical protein